MSRRVVGVTLDNLDDLPKHCRRACTGSSRRTCGSRPRSSAPPSWRRRPGSPACCWSGAPAAGSSTATSCRSGFVLYAPPTAVPRASAFPTSPVSPDAVAAHRLPRAAGVPRRRARPDAGAGRGQGPDPARRQGHRGVRRRPAGRGRATCVVPADFLLQRRLQDRPPAPALAAAAPGAAHARSAWKEDVEAALERLLGTVSVHRQPGPAALAACLRELPAQLRWHTREACDRLRATPPWPARGAARRRR